MAAQQREKEETEVNIPPICTPPPPQTTAPSPPPIPSARSPPPDPKFPGACDSRTSSARSPDLVESLQGNLKRPREASRCSGSGCRKKVGLMGFRCRCGDVFCPKHRYSDLHDCSYDYKAAGREAIEKENPVVRASKLLKV